jgi:hypothetical protein
MNLLLKLISSPWFWADFVLSVIGGGLVFWGLKIEKDAEKKENLDVFVDEVRARKLKSERGWRILMTGIVVEVVAALGISVISSLEIADLNDKTAASYLEAKEAGTNAAASYLEAKLAETNAAASNERAAVAERDAAQANELAAKFDADRVEIAKQAEEIKGTNFVLQARVLELEAKVRDRTITPEQKMAFILDTNSFQQSGVIRLGGKNMSRETLDYVIQIDDMLTNSGYFITSYMDYGTTSFVVDPRVKPDVWLIVKNMKSSPSVFTNLYWRFMSAGISVMTDTNRDPVFNDGTIVDTNEVLIFIPNKN